MNSQYAAKVATYVLAAGAVTTPIYSSIGLQCPMRSLGLACPGCGCGRALTSLISNGVQSAFRTQPTALLLLSTLFLLAITGRIDFVNRNKLTSSLVVLVPIHLAFVNLVFQLNRAGVFR